MKRILAFRKELKTGEWVEQYSTRSFYYTVEKSIYTEPFKDSNYWFTFKELYRLFNQYMEDGKTSWEDFIEQNREILESIDPGGEILTELIDSRGDFDRLSDRLNNLTCLSEGKDTKNKFYKKELLYKIPFRFSNYDEIIKLTDASYLYPQSFTIDQVNEEIFILYSPGGETNYTQRWIVVYNLITLEEKTVFGAGNAGGEGIVVKYTNSERRLYVKSKAYTLAEYDLTELPENQSILVPKKEYNLGLLLNFSYSNGKWLVEQDGASLGSYISRKTFHWLSDGLDRVTGTTVIDEEISGYWEGEYTNYISKRQGICIGKDGLLYQQSGGNYFKGDIQKPYNYQGVKVIDKQGNLLNEFLVDPAYFIQELENKGLVCDRIESESIFCDDSGMLYSLYVHNAQFNNDISKEQGIVIFREGVESYQSNNFLDFSKGSVTYNKLDRKEIENGVFPRSLDGTMKNPYTGESLNTFEKIINFLQGTRIKKFSFYSSATSVTDLNGDSIPSGYFVEIFNANNSTFPVAYKGITDTRSFSIHKVAGIFQQTEIFPSFSSSIELELANNISNYYAELPLKAQYNSGKVTLTGYVKMPVDRPVVISKLPMDMRPKENLSFVVALSASPSGGYGIVTIYAGSGEIRCVYTSSEVEYICLNNICFIK